MKIILEINNKSGCDIERFDLKRIVKRTIEKKGCDFLESKDVKVSIGLISQQEIKMINKKYRGIDAPTDVLSFSNYESQEVLQKEADKSVFLGEILVCCEDIEKYAKIKGSFFDQELVLVISHGILHLLGMSHGKKMFWIQKEVVNEIFS